MKFQENVLENFIKNAMGANKLDMIWDMFKIYLNNPNYYVKQEDVLIKILGNGMSDLEKMLNSLGIPLGKRKDRRNLTFGQLLKLCNI